MYSSARYHAARRLSERLKRLAVVALLTGPALSGQGQDRQLFLVWPKEHQTTPAAPSPTVTMQELRHKVPPRARKKMEKAEKARLANRLDDAIDLYKQTIAIDPEYVAARNNLATLYLRGADTNLGLEQLQEAITVSPHNAMLFRNLAIGYELARQIADAERAARMAVDLDRTGAEPRLLLGLILLEEHKFTDEALRCFERTALQYPLSHLLGGRVLIGQGEMERGKSEIQAYLASGDQDNRQIALKWLASLDDKEQELALASPR